MGHHQPNRVTQLVTPDLLMNQGPCFTHTPRQPLVAHWDEEGIGEDERETKRMKDRDTDRAAQREEDTASASFKLCGSS